MVQIVEIRPRNRNKNKKQKQSSSGAQVVVVPRPRSTRPRRRQKNTTSRPGLLSDVRVGKWDSLLRDPCGAELAHPCYSGCDSGYLIRTTNFYTPVNDNPGAAPVGSVVFGDFVFQWTPYNLSTTTGVVYAKGTQITPFVTGFPDFVSNSGVVKRYRPVAACLKWLPSGAYSTRAGVVGCAYSPGQLILGTDSTVVPTNLLAESGQVVPNGSRMHEVRWLPSEVDETFTTQTAANNTGAGSVLMVLKGVDGIATAAAQVTLNGYFEVTTTYEWIPNQTGNITVAPRAPLPYTSQQVLSTIGDMGSYLYDGLRIGVGRGLRMGGAMAGAYATQSVLTNGVRQMQRRGLSIGT